MDNQLQIQLTNLAITVLGGALSVLSIYASIYVKKAVDLAKAKAEQIQDAQAKQIVDNTLDKTNELIKTGIEALENTTKKDIIADIQNGKVDKTALLQLKEDVQNDVLKQLGDNGITVLNGAISDVDKYISDKIEATLGQLKLDPNSPVQKTVLPEVITPVVDTTELTNKLSQIQEEKGELIQQVNLISNDKASVEQQNQQLTNQVQDLQAQIQQLSNDKQIIQSKLDSITATLNQPVVTAQADISGITTNTIQ